MASECSVRSPTAQFDRAWIRAESGASVLDLGDRDRSGPQHVRADRVAWRTTPTTRPSSSGVRAGTVATASCLTGRMRRRRRQCARTPSPSSLPRNWRWTISTPCRSASGEGDWRAASSARSRLSTTSRRSARISRRPRSISFEISRRSRSRDSSNSARRLAVLGDVLLRDAIFLGELSLEILDVARLRPTPRLGRTAVVLPCPPAPVDDLYGDFVIFVHAGALSGPAPQRAACALRIRTPGFRSRVESSPSRRARAARTGSRRSADRGPRSGSRAPAAARRRPGRSPSAPARARASGSSVIAMRRSASCASSWRMNFSTIVSMTAGVSGSNETMASSRLRNSGLKTFSIALLRSLLRRLLPASSTRSDAPASAEADAGVAQLARSRRSTS